jgi:hypothetical protein
VLTQSLHKNLIKDRKFLHFLKNSYFYFTTKILKNKKEVKKMLVYVNKGKEVKLNSNEIKNVDVSVKEVIGTPFVPTQYVSSFSSPKIKVRSVIKIEINNIVVDEYEKDVVVGSNMLDEFESIKSMNENELFELTRNSFENEKDMLIEIVLRNRIK